MKISNMYKTSDLNAFCDFLDLELLHPPSGKSLPEAGAGPYRQNWTMIEKSSVTEEIPVAFDEEGSTDNEVIQVAEEVPVTAVAESQSAWNEELLLTY